MDDPLAMLLRIDLDFTRYRLIAWLFDGKFPAPLRERGVET